MRTPSQLLLKYKILASMIYSEKNFIASSRYILNIFVIQEDYIVVRTIMDDCSMETVQYRLELKKGAHIKKERGLDK